MHGTRVWILEWPYRKPKYGANPFSLFDPQGEKAFLGDFSENNLEKFFYLKKTVIVRYFAK